MTLSAGPSVSSSLSMGDSLLLRDVENSVIYQYDKPMPTSHWRRTKKAQVDLQENSFAIERQFEDQRLLMEQNRNPRALVPTKVDKVRSELIIARRGATRPIAVKAKVVNKIVREASAVHNYAIVPPPMTQDDRDAMKKNKDKEIDPDTHPLMAPYAKQAQAKPVIVSFGHRPRSASRTFHPATMKFRLKHSEIVRPQAEGKFGFGLPASVLASVLRAPSLKHEPMLAQGVDNTTIASAGSRDPHNLFTLSAEFVEEAADSLLDTGSAASRNSFGTSSLLRSSSANPQPGDLNALAEPSWVSAMNVSAKSSLTRATAAQKGSAALAGRPAWDEGFFNIKRRPKDVYAIKASGVLTSLKELPMSERLSRFRSNQIAEMAPLPWCAEKQETDRLVRAGQSVAPKKSVPVKGQRLYYDPLDGQLLEIKKSREHSEAAHAQSLRSRLYRAALEELPVVDYHPADELRALVQRTGVGVSEANRDKLDLQRAPGGEGLQAALRRARQGEQAALFSYFDMDNVQGINYRTRKSDFLI